MLKLTILLTFFLGLSGSLFTVRAGNVATSILVDRKDEKISNAKGSITVQIHSGGGIKVCWKKLMVKEISLPKN